jgi:hypothetical protein
MQQSIFQEIKHCNLCQTWIKFERELKKIIITLVVKSYWIYFKPIFYGFTEYLWIISAWLHQIWIETIMISQQHGKNQKKVKVIFSGLVCSNMNASRTLYCSLQETGGNEGN